MGMRSAALLLALSPLVQDEGLEEKLRRLRDHEEAARRIEKELAELGPAALPELKRLASSAGEALRARLEKAIGEIERRERIRPFRVEAPLVSLEADRKPLPDVLRDVSQAAGVELRLADRALLKTTLSVTLEGATLFDALDRICAAAEGLRWRAPQPRSRGAFVIERGAPADVHRAATGRAIVELAGVTCMTQSDFGVDVRHESRLELRAAWDSGLKPITARLIVTRLEDDTGASHVDDVQILPQDEGGWRDPAHRFLVVSPRRPPRGRGFRTISGVLELGFPSDVHVLALPRPAGREFVDVRGHGLDFKLLELRPSDRGWAGRVETEDPDFRRRDLRLVAEGGREYPARIGGGANDDGVFVHSISFDAPPTADLAELRLTQPVPGETLRLDWSLEGLRTE